MPYGVANRRGMPSRQEVGEILAAAAAAGIDTVDTAISYGESERALGETGCSGFRVVTKLPAIRDADDVERWVGEQVAGSLERLRVPKVYGLLLHRPAQSLEAHGAALYSALQRLKRDGLVEKIGISVYSPDELERILPAFPADLVQLPFNVFDLRARNTGWLRRMKDAGVEIHARSAFLQGLLLLPRGELPDKFSRWAPLFSKWSSWLENNAISPLEACLSLPLLQEEIDRVVVGVESVSQLSQIVGAAKSVRPGPAFDPGCVEEDLIDPGKWG